MPLRTRTAALALCAALGAISIRSVGVIAADFWDSKPFTEWSDKDLQRMLTDSPWSHQVSVVMPRSPREAGDLNPGGRGGGDESGRGFPTPAAQLKVDVQWRSAQPMRQAIALRQFGTVEKIPADVRDTLERDDSVYVVIVLGLPMQLAAAAADARKATFLRRDGHAPIAVSEGGPQKSGNGFALVFAFPRTDAIMPQDNEVEFVRSSAIWRSDASSSSRRWSPPATSNFEHCTLHFELQNFTSTPIRKMRGLRFCAI
jgi:hypothetical protein